MNGGQGGNLTSGHGMQTGAMTHVGAVRSRNEDSILALPDAGVWVVADGMGGHEAGDFASQTIVGHLATIGRPASAADLQARFLDRLQLAHDTILERARVSGNAPGATLAALLVCDGSFAAIWAGDSRVYLLRAGQFSQVTEDHSEVNELLRRGALTPEQAASWPRRNVITRAIGIGAAPQPELRHGALLAGDRFLICSDGLTEHVADGEMAEALSQHGPQEAAEALVALTLARGARDNVSVVLAYCPPDPGWTVR